MSLKPDTMVTLNITAASALKLYSIVGKMNGAYKSSGAFEELQRVLGDERRQFYDKYIYHERFDTAWEVINYASRQDRLERAFFKIPTEEEKRLESVEKQIRELEYQADELRKTINQQKGA